MNQKKRYVGFKAVNLKAALWFVVLFGGSDRRCNRWFGRAVCRAATCGVSFCAAAQCRCASAGRVGQRQIGFIAAAGNLATAYRVIDPSKRPELLVNGKAVGIDKLAMTASYATWVVSPTGSDITVIVDESPPANALKVILRITNLVPDCQATLKTAEGAVCSMGCPRGTARRAPLTPSGPPWWPTVGLRFRLRWCCLCCKRVIASACFCMGVHAAPN
jgi:hypothetical protein